LTLSDDRQLRASIIQQLMCHGRIDAPRLEREQRIRFNEYFSDAAPQLRQYLHDRLIEITPEAITATAAGRLLLRHIAMCFDGYLPAGGRADVRMSRAV
jgi:oxygen-independent coproporphyrinogen-3 oxidase